MPDKPESFIRFLDKAKAEIRRLVDETDWQEMHGGDLVEIQPTVWLDRKLLEAWQMGRNDALAQHHGTEGK